MLLSRRDFGLVVVSAPLVLSSAACGKPQTPLAHLYGKGWVHGAYEHYGKAFADLEQKSEEKTYDAYRMLAQRGISALDGLQSREVPFQIHVDDAEQQFVIDRDVPERLTFRADMTDKDREAAQASYDKAREHVHTDYEETKRLAWSLTRLLGEVQLLRGAIDKTQDEEFRQARQITEIRAGKLPFELPYEVTAKDYEEVLLLLIARLAESKKRLEALEGAIVSVGLTVRATDAGSASLASNIRKVLLAIVQDASDPEPALFPEPAERDKRLAEGKALLEKILVSPEYQAFLTRDRDMALEQIGGLLTILDRVTGLPTSRVYKLAVDIFRGKKDYFGYLKTVAGFIPGGANLAGVVEKAIGLTEKVRSTVEVINKKGVSGLSNVLVNTGTQFARDQVKKQLAFFENTAEAKQVESLLGETSLMKNPLPKLIPGLDLGD